jgi:hypothetical protein
MKSQESAANRRQKAPKLENRSQKDHCDWCEEPLAPEERNPHTTLVDMHHECVMRAVLGPLSHLERRCSCFIRREAARMVLQRWQAMTETERALANSAYEQ